MARKRYTVRLVFRDDVSPTMRARIRRWETAAATARQWLEQFAGAERAEIDDHHEKIRHVFTASGLYIAIPVEKTEY